MEIEELSLEFTGSGEVADFKFKQLLASPYAYVYEITAPNSKPHYEVFLRKECRKSETVVRGIKIIQPARVLYPKSPDFGIWAWCPRELSEAMKRFETLNKEAEAKLNRTTKKIRNEKVHIRA